MGTTNGASKVDAHVEAAERLGAALCGAVLCHPEWLDKLRELVSFAHMGYGPRKVWLAILTLADSERPIDSVSVGDHIDDFVTPVQYSTAQGVPLTLTDATWHAEQLRERWRQLEIARVAEDIKRAALDTPSSHLIEKLSEEAARLRLETAPTPVRLISIGQALEELEQLARAPIYPTPFPTLNDAIGFGGMIGTQVYTVAAGTGRGKTSFVAGIAAHAAQTVPVIVASYEMKPGYFVARKAAGVLGVHSNAILRGEVSMARVLAAMPYGRMWLMHKPSLLDLRTAVERIAQKYSTPPLVVVDYIQKLADEIARGQARPDLRIATSEASSTLLDIAEKTGAAIVAVSAIGRGKGRTLANPRRAAPYELVEVAKESGAVEYDGAGLIVLSLSDELDGDERIATMTLAKARFGEEMHIDARYDGRRGTWRDCGRVERETKTEGEAAPLRAELQRKILDELGRSPAKSANALYKTVKGNKTAFNETLAALFEHKLITKNPMLPGDGICLPSQAPANDPQTAFGGAE